MATREIKDFPNAAALADAYKALVQSGDTDATEHVTMQQLRTFLAAYLQPINALLTDISAITGLTKGDIIVHNGANLVKLVHGSDGQVLTAEAAQASGLKWGPGGGGGGGHVIVDSSGTSLTQRANLKFRSGLTAIDNGVDTTEVIPEVGLLGGGSSVLYDTTLSAATQTIDITGLSSKCCELIINVKNDSASAAAIGVYVNGDTNIANYWGESITGTDGATLTAAESNDSISSSVSAGLSAAIRTLFVAGPQRMWMQITRSEEDGTDVPVVGVFGRYYKGTNPAALTSIRISASVANGLGVGTRIILRSLEVGPGGAATHIGGDAYLSTVQNITDGAAAVTVNIDALRAGTTADGITFDTANKRFVVQQTGWYTITGQVSLEQIAANGYVYCAVAINGTEQRVNVAGCSSSAAATYAASVTLDSVYLAAGDAVTLLCRQSTGANRNLVNASSQTFLSLTKLAVGSLLPTWISWTPSINWTSGYGTILGRYKDHGDTLEIDIRIPITGSVLPAATSLTFTLPAGFSYHPLLAQSDYETAYGAVNIDVVAAGSFLGVIGNNGSSTNSMLVVVGVSSSTHVSATGVTNTVPATLANGDSIHINARIPVTKP